MPGLYQIILYLDKHDFKMLKILNDWIIKFFTLNWIIYFYKINYFSIREKL